MQKIKYKCLETDCGKEWDFIFPAQMSCIDCTLKKLYQNKNIILNKKNKWKPKKYYFYWFTVYSLLILPILYYFDLKTELLCITFWLIGIVYSFMIDWLTEHF